MKRPDDILREQQGKKVHLWALSLLFACTNGNSLFPFPKGLCCWLLLPTVKVMGCKQPKRTNQEMYVPCGCHSLTQARGHTLHLMRRVQRRTLTIFKPIQKAVTWTIVQSGRQIPRIEANQIKRWVRLSKCIQGLTSHLMT